MLYHPAESCGISGVRNGGPVRNGRYREIAPEIEDSLPFFLKFGSTVSFCNSLEKFDSQKSPYLHVLGGFIQKFGFETPRFNFGKNPLMSYSKVGKLFTEMISPFFVSSSVGSLFVRKNAFWLVRPFRLPSNVFAL